jgi:transposase
MPLSEKQLVALQILSKRGTYEEAATAAKVSRRTVIRWAKIPEFKEQLGNFSKARVKAASKVIEQQQELQVENLVPKALAKIRDILEDSDSRRSDQLRAAELVGRWAGLGQVQQEPETSPAEENLKGYLNYLASTTNGKHSTTSPNLN